ncbi:hypothetical protein [Tepidibacillus sp. HK-1]|uniref:hypothetical protein n=1 Tax=Tepidibacillus sp. HK-1 TaxID=1883407 RepID=UPI0008531725|nr:hypothetical protein [Tepidibacillus sp. HK-1]GBF10345.1 hypothetical protein HK1_00357 [Tepidibacillus sp. HK-1]
MENKEKLAVDLFIKYSSRDLAVFKQAVAKAKMIMIRDIHLNERFKPQKYARYFLTFRILKLPEQKPLPQFNIFQQRIERLQNAALSLELLEIQLQNLGQIQEELFCYLEIGGLYVLEEDPADQKPWYSLF